MTDTPKLSRLTVLFNDGFSYGGGMLPEPPSERNTVSNLADARELFREWLDVSGNDYVRAEGYSQPSATVYLTDSYDDIAYSEYPYAMFELGPRAGIVRVSI